MEDHNERAELIWSIIEDCATWKRALCVDIGCGHGDFVWRMKKAGATYVLGVDNDPKALIDARNRRDFHESKVTLLGSFIQDWMPNHKSNWFNVGLCLSVLPYLHWSHKDALKQIRRIVKGVMFFEVQYFGDGPGREEVKNDDDMRKLLNHSWDKVEWLGATEAKANHMRSVWRCE